jgi:hypothetical protein
MRTTRTRLALVALSVAATTLAGCTAGGNGVTDLSADEIMQRSTAALATAKTFRFKGTIAFDGVATVDFRVDGADFAGTLKYIPGFKVDLVVVGGRKFVRQYAGSSDTTTTYHWVTGPDTDHGFADTFTAVSVAELLKPTGTLGKGGQKEIGGVPAIALTDSGDPESITHVATSGEPYPLQLTGKGGASAVFSDFGAAFAKIEAPPADDVVDVAPVAPG